MSSSIHVHNKKKDILILGKGPTQRLEHTLTAEEMHSINFTVKKKKISKGCLTTKLFVWLLMAQNINLRPKILKL